MWRYIILNSLWFSILFLVHFVGSPGDRRIVMSAMLLIALSLAARAAMDPFAWFFYATYSLLVFHGAYQFRQWSSARVSAAEEEIAVYSKRLEVEKGRLEEKKLKVTAAQNHAQEISDFYDKLKDMSQSLDPLETFLIFGEALAKNFNFQTVKLFFFNEEVGGFRYPVETFQLKRENFGPHFERSLYLKDRKKTKGELFPVEEKVLKRLFEEMRPLYSSDDFEPSESTPFFSAHPIFINEKIFAALEVIGLDGKQSPLFRILTERFVSEMQRVRLYERVEMLAITDGLTGVYVRRHLLERLEEEVDRSKRFGFKFSFLMIDVDFFKRFNDEYGHLVGDVVLKQVAQTIRRNVREVDLVGRYGGEEFGVLLIETEAAQALRVADRIRQSVQEKDFRAYDETLKVTVSVGCATYVPSLGDVHLIVEAADSALYQAKRHGRNTVCLSDLTSS